MELVAMLFAAKNKRLFFGCAVFSLAWILTLPSKAQETVSASFFDGYGAITLSWSHSLSTPNGLAYVEVNVNTETLKKGAATATASAEATPLPNDMGTVATKVTAESLTIGSKGLADAGGSAKSFFLLRNTSDQNIKVDFHWSADWLIEGAIENPETDRVDAALYLVLTKDVVRFNNAEALTYSIENSISKRRVPGSVFSRFVSTSQPPELPFLDVDNIAGEFSIHFGARMTYLFVLSGEIHGVATVKLGGCPSSYWRGCRDWPIDSRARFVDVFGAGPDIPLSHAVRLRNSTKHNLVSNAVSALLNATSPNISYVTEEPSEIQALINGAFESGEFESTNTWLEYYNSLGYPQVCE